MKVVFRKLFTFLLIAAASLAHAEDEESTVVTWPEAVTTAVATYPYLDGSIIGKYLKRCYKNDATSPGVFNCLEGYLSGSTPGLTYSERLAVTTAKNKAASQEKIQQAKQRAIEIDESSNSQARTSEAAASGRQTANHPSGTARSQTEPSQAEMDAWGAIGHALGCMLSGGYCPPSNANPYEPYDRGTSRDRPQQQQNRCAACMARYCDYECDGIGDSCPSCLQRWCPMDC